jgi:DNA-binding XRE family transcriptional regulator
LVGLVGRVLQAGVDDDTQIEDLPAARAAAAHGGGAMATALETYEDQIAAARASAAPGEDLDLADMRALLAAPTPLRFWRTKRGMTQAELASAAGLSQSFLSDLETGKAEGGARALRALADALCVTLDDLVPGAAEAA